MKRAITLTILVVAVVAAVAQMANPVKFTTDLKTSGTEGEMVFSGHIEPGWHVYSTNLGNAGPIEASLHVNRLDGAELVGKLQPRGKEISAYDKMFGATLRYFEGSVQFVQKVKFTKPKYDIDCYLEYGACSDEACLPPSEVMLKKKGEAPVAQPKPGLTPDPSFPSGARPPVAFPTGEGSIYSSNGEITSDSTNGNSNYSPLPFGGRSGGGFEPGLSAALWQPVVDELRAFGGDFSLGRVGGEPHSWLYILLMGFVGGLLAVLMPCIWPIIPMTVSFFLKQAKDDKRRGIRDALIYGASIVVVYLTLGLLVTALFGSDTLNALSTNAVFNVFLALLLVVFALSFFGWFELKLPDRWANAVDAKAANTSGLISIFLMAFTLVLVSFSCTAPIVGFLLVETTTSSNLVAPALGMLGFALALALPFTLFALFPSWLKQAPKSGSWMNMLKVVLGFIELAFALKFFSVADLAYGWHLLDREVFLSLWIAIFLLLGLYLIGLLRFQSDGDERRAMPVVCIMGGLVSIAFAVYMLPGLWGAPCKAVSAFAPPMSTQDFNLNTHVVEARFTDYEQGMAAARAEGKPVLIDFTGFGCVNCRKMEAAVWTDPRVAERLENDYVLISLYVDDKHALPEPFVVEENGEKRELATVAKKWSYLQAHKFGANTQPFYVAIDSNGRPLAPSFGYKEDPQAFLDFLNQGLKRFTKK